MEILILIDLISHHPIPGTSCLYVLTVVHWVLWHYFMTKILTNLNMSFLLFIDNNLSNDVLNFIKNVLSSVQPRVQGAGCVIGHCMRLVFRTPLPDSCLHLLLVLLSWLVLPQEGLHLGKPPGLTSSGINWWSDRSLRLYLRALFGCLNCKLLSTDIEMRALRPTMTIQM